jgi:organic radical activating enzyme
MSSEYYIKYKKRVIDSVSESFCAAKWLNATIWLGSGTTTSCHHPPAQKIDIEEIKTNPSAIHNTCHKKEMRKQMLEGTRPDECEYCWKIEDIGRDNISDRVFKTIIYSDEKINEIVKAPWNQDVDLETLEIAFDRTCNFACTYCNSSFSTAWGRDIKINGPYTGLFSDGAKAFEHDGSWADATKDKEANPYIGAFWQWWPTLSQSLKELRITGGEPLMSDDVWKLMDKFRDEKLQLKLAINTNLGSKDSLIDRLIEKSKNIAHLDLYTSCEAFGPQAEYIRDGMDFRQFVRNCEKVLNEANVVQFGIMMTITSLCLFSITDFMDVVLQWKKKYPKTLISMSVNLLRFPSFMSPLALPEHIKHDRLIALKKWRDEHSKNVHLGEWELASLDRLIDYLDIVKTPHSATSDLAGQWSDFKLFFEQYDKRRSKKFRDTFPPLLVNWVDSIEIKNDEKL